MNKILTLSLLTLIFIGSGIKAQYRFEYGGGIGVANYLGDIGGGAGPGKPFLMDLKMSKTRQSVCFFMRYKLLPAISIKTEFNYFRISADDKLSANPARHLRNLNFVNDMVDLTTQAQLKLYDAPSINSNKRFRIGMRVYAGAGLGVFYSNPKAVTNSGNVALRPLTTEGVSYNALGICLPVSGGVYFTMKKYHRLTWELCWRNTFTDYIDDVSDRYPDPSTLSPMGALLSSRTHELEDANDYGIELNNFTTGGIRGNPKNNDSYLTMNITYSYVLRGQSSFYRSKYGSFFSKTAKKGRKIRAKF